MIHHAPRLPHSSAICAEGWEPRTSTPYSFVHHRAPAIPAHAEAQIFLERLVEIRPPVRLSREGRATGRPETVSRVMRYAKKSANRVSISRHPVRLVSGAASRIRPLATFRAQCDRNSYIN